MKKDTHSHSLQYERSLMCQFRQGFFAGDGNVFFEDSPQCSDFDGERVVWPSQLTANVCVNQNNDTKGSDCGKSLYN